MAFKMTLIKSSDRNGDILKECVLYICKQRAVTVLPLAMML